MSALRLVVCVRAFILLQTPPPPHPSTLLWYIDHLRQRLMLFPLVTGTVSTVSPAASSSQLTAFVYLQICHCISHLLSA